MLYGPRVLDFSLTLAYNREECNYRQLYGHGRIMLEEIVDYAFMDSQIMPRILLHYAGGILERVL